jgi:hypothetical protein
MLPALITRMEFQVVMLSEAQVVKSWYLRVYISSLYIVPGCRNFGYRGGGILPASEYTSR